MTPDSRDAGSIILKDLELFNKAAVFLEEEIDPLIRVEFGRVVAAWLKTHAMLGESDLSESFDALWVGTGNWLINGETDEWFALIEFGLPADAESNSYEIADLFGVGQAECGLRFVPRPSPFGGARVWNIYAKSQAFIKLGARLEKMGWRHEGKGVFFRPLVLAEKCLVEAWISEDWSGALAPLTDALDAVKAAMPIFNAMIDDAKPKDPEFKPAPNS